MGSYGRSEDLPPASAPFLALVHPTSAELRRIWTMTHGPWGPALSREDYVQREAYLYTIPGSKDGLQSSWILTDSRLPPDSRPILSSCDTYRKAAVVSYPPPPPSSSSSSEQGATPARDAVAHAIGAVFTDPEFRGQGYATRMMKELREALRTYQADLCQGGQAKGNALFTVLYSDIGKKFYSKFGWVPDQSTHVSWMPAPEENGSSSSSSNASASASTEDAAVRPIDRGELAGLCALDEELLREHLPEIAAKTGRAAVALVPNLDTMVWHLDREDYMCSHIFPDGRTPQVRGAVFTSPSSGRRVWAVWARNYYGGLAKAEGNTLYLLRVVVEDADRMPAAELARGFRGILAMAQREARLWRVCNVQMWNPTGVVRRMVEECGIPCEWVTREEDSISSLMWYGGGDGGGSNGSGGGGQREVEWVANDKFAWC